MDSFFTVKEWFFMVLVAVGVIGIILLCIGVLVTFLW
jgi:hypothetical protein